MHLKRIYSPLFEWNVEQLSIKSIWSNMSFKITVSLFIFCLDDLFIDVSGVLKSPTIMVLLSIFLFMSVHICFIYLGAYMFMNVISSCWIDPLYHYVVPLFVFITVFVLKFILSDMTIATPAFYSFPFACYIYFSILSLSISMCLQL